MAGHLQTVINDIIDIIHTISVWLNIIIDMKRMAFADTLIFSDNV